MKKKAMTIRLKEEDYINIKIKLLKENKTFQDYVLELIKKDMEE